MPAQATKSIKVKTIFKTAALTGPRKTDEEKRILSFMSKVKGGTDPKKRRKNKRQRSCDKAGHAASTEKCATKKNTARWEENHQGGNKITSSKKSDPNRNMPHAKRASTGAVNTATSRKKKKN